MNQPTRPTSGGPTRASTIELPRIPPLVLDDLHDSSAASLEPADLREGERIVGADITRLHAGRAVVRGSVLELTGVGELNLDDGRLVSCRFTAPQIGTLSASAGTWREVEIAGGRIADLAADRATWEAVSIGEARIGYANLRGARLRDVRLADCRIDTLDLTGATATRVELAGCLIGELMLSGATLSHVDLRTADLGDVDDPRALSGVTVTPTQLVGLAPALAAALGIEVEPADQG